MAIDIFPPGRGSVPAFDAPFALKQDNWNDFGFQAQYHLYQSHPDGSAPSLVGSVKILRRGQTEQDGLQITEAFERLDDRFCSVGTSLDYYQRLNEMEPQQRDGILTALRDVVAHPELQPEFASEPGWATSLFRDNPDPAGFLADATALLTNNFTALPDLQLAFSFHPTGWKTPLRLDFDAPNHFWSRSGLPRRIIVVIGRNGSGKSTLLSRIARVAFAAPSDRRLSEIESIGTFDPPTIGFTKIIAISYSAFDNFIVPGSREAEVRQITEDLRKGTGRYIYTGLRDIVAEADQGLHALEERTFPNKENPIVTTEDRRTTTCLKSLDQLADEFERLAQRISDNGDDDLLAVALQPLLADPSFADLGANAWAELLGESPRAAFLAWSTGHKIALHVVTSLVAYATRRSLVLFDEPEMHLHPPLTAALMHAVREVLERKNAFAIVATHSPVVLQETLAQQVRIVRRSGGTFDVLAPSMETFGENVGTLTYDAFGLTAEATDFHQSLDRLIAAHHTLDEINELFTPGLSGQALAYVMAGLARKARTS